MAFRRFRRFPPRAKPVKVGEEYDVEISEIGSKGDGIARVKNFVVFVENSKKGEKARIKIREVHNKFALADKIESKEQKEQVEEPREYVEGVEEVTAKAVEEAEEMGEEAQEEETEEVEETEE